MIDGFLHNTTYSAIVSYLLILQKPSDYFQFMVLNICWPEAILEYPRFTSGSNCNANNITIRLVTTD